jgi:hypothetical protein
MTETPKRLAPSKETNLLFAFSGNDVHFLAYYLKKAPKKFNPLWGQSILGS